MIGEGRVAAPVIEGRAEEFVILLVEAIQARLEIVSGDIGAEGYLSAGVIRSAMVGGCNGNIRGQAVVVGGVVVIERGNRK